jgi:hypothetical protein
MRLIMRLTASGVNGPGSAMVVNIGWVLQERLVFENDWGPFLIFAKSRETFSSSLWHIGLPCPFDQ